MFRPALCALATIALTSAAHAGGVPASPPAAPVVLPQATQDWTGAYGGVQLEYGRGDIDYSTVPGLAFPDSDVDGAMAGLFFGYRVDYGSWVVGAEFDYMAGSLDADTPGITSVDTILRSTIEVGLDAGNALIYGTAGVTGMFVSSAIPGVEDDWGGVYGIGVDYRLNEGTIIGAELLQHQVDDFAGSGADLSVTTFGVNIGFQF